MSQADVFVTADREYLTRKAAFAGFQTFSLLAPPAYVVLTFAKSGRGALSLNRTLRASWLGGLGGALTFGGATYLRHKNQSDDVVHVQRMKVAYNANRLRKDDYATIGGFLGVILAPAILWNRAHFINLVLGGASIGSAIGMTTHVGKSFTNDPPHP